MAKQPSNPKAKGVSVEPQGVAKKLSKAMTAEQVGRMVDAKLKAFEADLVAAKRIQPRAQ